jgi:hypothetical protein
VLVKAVGQKADVNPAAVIILVIVACVVVLLIAGVMGR